MDDSRVEIGAPTPAIRTFLFADIRGYTRFLVERGDAEGAKLVERFGSVVRSVLGAHGGEILEVAGDEAIAVFASARQALKAATELQVRLGEESRADPAFPLQVGVGVDTGESIRVGDNYVGTALNLAARLCKLAGPQEVLASDGVVHVARRVEGLAYVDRGMAQLKGFQEPVRVIRVVDAAKEPSVGEAAEHRISLARGAETPIPLGAFLGALPTAEMVARERELGLGLAAADAVAAGRGRFVVLSGEAGVGKTRIAQEIMLNLRNRRFLVATGRCYDHLQTVPFYPFLDALGQAYASCPSKLQASAAIRWPYLGHLLPELRSGIAPAAESSPEEQQRLFRAVTGFLEAVAEELPVAILLDDLHWADAASLELLQHIARSTRAGRVLLVATYRDSEVGRHHPLEAALRDLVRDELVDRISVRRLGADATSKLVANTLGQREVGSDLASLVYRQSEGNPFFAQHLTRYLVERGNLHLEAGHWTLDRAPGIEVPESIRSVVGQRLEKLADETQEVLREAAVLGPTFEFEALARLANRSEARVEVALEAARAAGLIEERGNDWFGFDHALTQQTLYSEIPGRKRRRLHLAVGEVLEKLPADARAPLSAELAWHFIEAGQEERAIPHALVAGDRARAVFAYREADRQYSSAIEVAHHAGDRAHEVEGLTRRAQLRLNTFQGKRAAEDYEQLLELARKSGDRSLELEARLGLGRASYIVALDETESDVASKSRTMFESAYALAKELGDRRGMVRALLGTEWFPTFWPQNEGAWEKNAREIQELTRELGDEELELQADLATWLVGSRAEAEARYVRLVRDLKARNDPYRLNEIYFSAMWANLRWAEYERTIEICDVATRLAGEIGVPPVQYPTLKALALIRLGRFGDAWDSLQLEVTDSEHRFGQAFQRLGIGIYCQAVEGHEEAAQIFLELLARSKQLHRAWMTSWCARLLALSAVRDGVYDASALHRAEEELRSLGEEFPPEVLAEIGLSEGNPDAALGQARKGAEEALATEHRTDLLMALEQEGRALLELGRPSEVLDVVEQALGIAVPQKALPRVWRLLALKGMAARALGNRADAERFFSEASACLRSVSDSIRDYARREAFLQSPATSRVLRAVEGTPPVGPQTSSD